MKRCYQCKRLYPDGVDFCGGCGTPLLTVTFWDRHKSLLLSLAVVTIIVIGLLSLKSQRPSPSALTNPRSPSSTAAKPVPTVRMTRWGYSEFNDEMGRGRVCHTSIESTNTISLDSPYAGVQHATLSIRDHPQHGKDVYIRIEKGQLLDSQYHGNVVVRFDDDKPISFPSVGPSDLSSETLFLRGNAFTVFVRRLKTAKTLRIEVPVYQEGNQILDFDVEGFTWKQDKPDPKK